VVFAKACAFVLVLGVVPATLWLAGFLPPPVARSDVVASETRTISEETAWRTRMGAICGWERKQGRTLEKVFRRASSPADVQLLFQEAIRLSDESLAMFKRLNTPLEYRREARTLQRLSWQERMAIKHALEAFKDGKRAAFVRAIRGLVVVDSKSSNLLAQLGIDGCNVKPVTVPQGSRDRIV
jgi:hypothetical protein